MYKSVIWKPGYLGTLPKDKSALVESTQSNSIYKFGDAKETKQFKQLKQHRIVFSKNFQ